MDIDTWNLPIPTCVKVQKYLVVYLIGLQRNQIYYHVPHVIHVQPVCSKYGLLKI